MGVGRCVCVCAPTLRPTSGPPLPHHAGAHLGARRCAQPAPLSTFLFIYAMHCARAMLGCVVGVGRCACVCAPTCRPPSGPPFPTMLVPTLGPGGVPNLPPFPLFFSYMLCT